MKEREDLRADVTPVTIYGHTYHLRGNEDGKYLIELASLVDRKMREVAEATGTADTLKVAILSALNLADDCIQARRGIAPAHGAPDPRLARLVSTLSTALGA
jgi:cell division protein ZapA